MHEGKKQPGTAQLEKLAVMTHQREQGAVCGGTWVVTWQPSDSNPKHSRHNAASLTTKLMDVL